MCRFLLLSLVFAFVIGRAGNESDIYLQNPGNKGSNDAIEFSNGVSNIWIDHVTIGQCADGVLDFKRGADLATVSWCKFAYTDRMLSTTMPISSDMTTGMRSPAAES